MTNPKEKQREYNRRFREKHKDQFMSASGVYGKEYIREAVARFRANNPEQNRFTNRMNKAKRRARLNNARVEKYIKKTNITNWGLGICGICGESLEGDYHIDHIIPLSGGGEHSASNLQLAHPICNRQKFTAIIIISRDDRTASNAGR